jgi:cysteine-rich repeat protein
MRTIRASVFLLLCLSLGACGITREHLDEVLNSGPEDAGRLPDGQVNPGEDAGPVIRFDDVCGAENPEFLLRDTTPNIMVDTTSYANNNTGSCNAMTPGNDVFLAVDVQAGEFWHFHLSALTPNREPILFLTTDACDQRDCEFSSNSCDMEGDEHFAFIADESARWYLGIDDEVAGGAMYSLSAFRPSCGLDGREHGEGCDDGNNVDGDGCDSECHEELTTTRNAEVEPNDNLIEANTLVLPPSNAMEVTGGIGGPGGCLYPDVFAISIPAGGDIHVDALTPAGTACTSETLTPYDINLQNAGGDIIAGTEDANGCSIFRGTDLPEGRYYIRLDLTTATSTVASYRIHAEILP